MKKKKKAPKPKSKTKAAKKAVLSKRSSLRKAARPRSASKKPKMASRRPKANEVGSDRSLRSSLTEPVGLAPNEDVAELTAGQSGDLQGLSNVEDADSQSVDELLEDGQAYEAEVVEGVEGAPNEKPVPRRGRLEVQGEEPPDYENKNRI